MDVLWPDFDRRHLWRACEIFASRDRRYGGAVRTRGGDAAAEAEGWRAPFRRYRRRCQEAMVTGAGAVPPGNIVGDNVSGRLTAHGGRERWSYIISKTTGTWGR